MLDHIGFAVADYARSRRFYAGALEPLGITIGMEQGASGMLVKEGAPFLWFGSLGEEPARPFHFAFAAESREAVRRFHAAALAAGGRDNGGPGVREQYHPTYYAAFVFDPDGHNVEAVCHAPGEAADQTMSGVA